MTHETFVAQLCCATKVARVSYLVAESCNKLRNKSLVCHQPNCVSGSD